MEVLLGIKVYTFFFWLLKQEQRKVLWLISDMMHHRWLLLAACFWVIFMYMVASKFITLTFKDPDGK